VERFGEATAGGGVHRNEMRWSGANGTEGWWRHETERNRRENSTTTHDSTKRVASRATGSGPPFPVRPPLLAWASSWPTRNRQNHRERVVVTKVKVKKGGLLGEIRLAIE